MAAIRPVARVNRSLEKRHHITDTKQQVSIFLMFDFLDTVLKHWARRDLWVTIIQVMQAVLGSQKTLVLFFVATSKTNRNTVFSFSAI